VSPTAAAVSAVAVHKADHPSPLRKVFVRVPPLAGTKPL